MSSATFALIDKLLAVRRLGSRCWLAGLQERDERMPREHWHRARLHIGPNCGKIEERERERKKVKCHHVYPSQYHGLSTEGSALPSGSMWSPVWPSANDELKLKTALTQKAPRPEHHEWSCVFSHLFCSTYGPSPRDNEGWWDMMWWKNLLFYPHRFQTARCLDCCHAAAELQARNRFKPHREILSRTYSICALISMIPAITLTHIRHNDMYPVGILLFCIYLW